MENKTLGKLQEKVTKLENIIIKQRDLIVIRKEKFRTLQMKYKYLEKNMNKIIEKSVNQQVEKKIQEVQDKNEKLKLEVARLKGVLNVNSSNAGIPTSKTAIRKKKHIPNSREKSDEKLENNRDIVK